jgi:hypothetical protein
LIKPSLYVYDNKGNFFYKLQNWFESNQKLFAKFSNKNQKKKKEKEKELIKEERVRG